MLHSTFQVHQKKVGLLDLSVFLRTLILCNAGINLYLLKHTLYRALLLILGEAFENLQVPLIVAQRP